MTTPPYVKRARAAYDARQREAGFERVTLKLHKDVVAILDELKGSQSRSDFIASTLQNKKAGN